MIPFTKYQGTGNDFVLLDATDVGESDWGALATRLCDRHYGVGGDGLLVALPSDRAALRMRMFNPDGTEDMCGNGLRCVALHAFESGLAPEEIVVETLAGLRQVRILRHDPGCAEVRAEMGQGRTRPDAVPIRVSGSSAVGIELPVGAERVRITAVSTGSTHAVIFGPEPEEKRFQRLSRQLENHEMFPERTSVLWATIESSSRARVRIWERGVGETLACGTGACAVAVAGRLEGKLDNTVTVASRGGELRVEVDGRLNVHLTGEARRVFRGTWQG